MLAFLVNHVVWIKLRLMMYQCYGHAEEYDGSFFVLLQKASLVKDGKNGTSVTERSR
jgi:hypothetical protein